MPRTYGALGPQGSNLDMLIPRPDLAPAPVVMQAGPVTTKKQREGLEEQHARRRRERREGIIFREEMKRAMRESRDFASRSADENRMRDFDYREAVSRAPLERSMMREALRMKQAEDPGLAERLAKLESGRAMDIARLEAQTRMALQGGEADMMGRRQQAEALQSLLPVLASANMGDYALMLMMQQMGPMLQGGGQAGGGPMAPADQSPFGAFPDMERDIQRTMRDTAEARTMGRPEVQAWLETMGRSKDYEWGKPLVGLPSGEWSDVLGLRRPGVRLSNVAEFVRQIRQNLPPGVDPDSEEQVLALAKALVNNPEFADEFASDLPFTPGREDDLRMEILRMLSDPTNRKFLFR